MKNMVCAPCVKKVSSHFTQGDIAPSQQIWGLSDQMLHRH